MTPADGRPTRSHGSIHIGETQNMSVPERRYSREHGMRADVDDRYNDDATSQWVRNRERAPRRRQSASRLQHNVVQLRGGGRPNSESEIPSFFFMFDRGKPVLIKDERKVGLNWSNQKLLAHLQAQYRALHYGWILKPYTWVQDIGMIYVLVWVFDERTRRIRLVNKAELVESPDKSGSLSAHDFRYILDNPPPGKFFARTVAKFLQGARGASPGVGRHPRVVLMFEFANLPRARVLVTLALFTIPISAIVGILYGVLQGPIADAISLASYIATAFSLFFAILGAGILLGIDQPHVYTATDDLLEEYVVQRRIREGLFYARGRFGEDNGKPGDKDAVSV
ncbi:hypothetical protein B0T24DRAFT_640294 [Lasiosphaeria ovina]|uniref:Uncharacterized protein n=1 Tax=Lasiosphaeria ovina TaxID=92902 RepID=A0AAE0MZA5_9PEZI|nr:hypothetical protein B0T24DRAFT_640294 [Lasiosphaeria ovina]